MQDIVEMDIARAIRDHAHPLRGTPADYDPLLAMIGESPLVLLGEASHGTHEFYAARAHITERLIAEKGFTAVAVEADWPDAYRASTASCAAPAPMRTRARRCATSAASRSGCGEMPRSRASSAG